MRAKRKEKEIEKIKEKEINNYNVYYLCDKIYIKKELKKEKYNKSLKETIIKEDEFIFKVNNRFSLTLKKLVFNSSELIEPVIEGAIGVMSVTALLINKNVYISFNNISAVMYFTEIKKADENIYNCEFLLKNDKILSCLLDDNKDITKGFEYYKSIINYNTMINNGYYSMNKDNKGTSYNLDYKDIEEQLENLKSELWDLNKNYELFLNRMKVMKEINKKYKGSERFKALKVFKNQLKHRKEKYFIREIKYISYEIESLKEKTLRNSDEFQESEDYYISATYADI